MVPGDMKSPVKVYLWAFQNQNHIVPFKPVLIPAIKQKLFPPKGGQFIMANLTVVGLLRRLSLLDPSVIKEKKRLFTEFKGALTENYILTGVIEQFEGIPCYWESGNKAEVDFLVQHQNKIIPYRRFL